ncbi:hypothetical protein ARTSIC4J27_413 [Pseudarthrobacter siccitolerans]|uniref:Uncharacterized protein n=1 Tax=Pseudarthrobacter siccitolerans TaxID=861266 RepID=A0A024GY23_9MICC|nr:hypothetical protein ARTSIC4J27_413 [Pseudarthrobacter siccitolerans]
MEELMRSRVGLMKSELTLKPVDAAILSPRSEAPVARNAFTDWTRQGGKKA